MQIKGKQLRKNHSQLLTLLHTASPETPAAVAQISTTSVPAATGDWCNLAWNSASFCTVGKSTDLRPRSEKELAFLVFK